MLILKPFPTDRPVPSIDISASLDRHHDILTIEYQLLGDLNEIEIPAPAAAPNRKSLLWEHTCFEFFLGVPGLKDYWEFNLSPGGDWNIFHLDDYRQGLRDELAFTALAFEVDRQPNLLSLRLALDLAKIIPADRDLEISVTTVIESRSGEISYWAVTHSGETADFHLRDSFTIKLGDPKRDVS